MACCFWKMTQKVHKQSKYHKKTQVNRVKLLPQRIFLKLHHKWQKSTTSKRTLNSSRTNSIRKNLSNDSKRIEKPQGDKSSLNHIRSQTQKHSACLNNQLSPHSSEDKRLSNLQSRMKLNQKNQKNLLIPLHLFSSTFTQMILSYKA